MSVSIVIKRRLDIVVVAAAGCGGKTLLFLCHNNSISNTNQMTQQLA
jgi:hypothetical protein